MKIGELARRAGVRASAVRYYERIGLLPRAPRSGGQRRYEPEMLDRLAVIELCQQSGFTLEEVGVLLRSMTPVQSLSQVWRPMVQRKIGEMDELIVRVTAMRELLVEGLRCECLRLSDCALTARIQRERARQGIRGPREALPRRRGSKPPGRTPEAGTHPR